MRTCLAMKISVTKRMIKKAYDRGEKIKLFMLPDGSFMNYGSTLNELEKMERRGLKYIPNCDNVDETGKCKGHGRTK